MSVVPAHRPEQDDDPLGDLPFEFLIDRKGMGLHYAYSYGLARRGLPELYVGPGPRGGPPGPEEPGPGALVERARWLVEAARRLVLGTLREGEVLPSEDREWWFWAGPRERPAGILGVALPGVETVVPILWAPAR